jgi:MFS family permease
MEKGGVTLSGHSNYSHHQSVSGIWSVLAWVICLLAALFYCYEYLLRISPNVMVPELMKAFNVPSADGVAALVGYYYYAYTPMQIPVGLLLDKYGPRRILTLATLCCAIGAVLFATTSSYMVAAIARFLIGFGSAFAFVGVLKVASIWLPPNRFAFISGFTTALGMLGGMFGNWSMNKMVATMGWDGTLSYFGWFGFFVVPIMWLLIRDVPNFKSKSIQRVETTFGQLISDFFTLCKNRQIWINGLIGGFIMMPTMVFAELWGGEYVQQVYGIEKDTAIQLVTMILLGWAVGGPITGMISDKLNNRRMPLIIGALLAALVTVIFIYSKTTSIWMIGGLLFLLGVFSSAENICFAVSKEISPPQVAGSAIATTNFIVVLVGMIFQRAASKLIDFFWSGAIKADGTPLYSAEVFQYTMLIMPTALVLAAIMAYFWLQESGKTLIQK